jgi:hypothetical protein
VTVSEVDESITGEATLSVDVNGDGEPARDTTGDGLLNDVKGDGSFTIFDVQAFFLNFQNTVVQENPALFNFDNDEPSEVTIADVQSLFIRLG